MATEWINTTVGAQATLQRGFDITKAEQRAGTIPVVSSSGISSHHDTASAKGPGVILGRKGVVGSVYYIISDYWPHDTSLWVKDFHGNETRFVYYFFKWMTPRIAAMDVGSANPTLNRNHVHPIQIMWPPKSEQRAIAHILGTLDDKIDLNRQMNETLEAMARALFKAWFVDFEPVRAKLSGRWRRGQSLPGLPAHLYDLCPDRLVESELGEIPEGWKPFAFGDIARQNKGVINPSRLFHTAFNHYSLPAFDSSQSPMIELGEIIKSNKTPVPNNSVLVLKLNPHIPRIWHVGKAGDNAVCSTEFIVWTPKAPANSAFLYCITSSTEFISAMRQLVTGTSNSHQRVRPEQMQGICIFSANKKAISAFSRIMQGLMDQVLQNRQLSLTITRLRDTLLPKLISGEMRITGAERPLQRAEL